MKIRYLVSALFLLLTITTGVRAETTTAPNWTLQTPDGTSVELAEVSRNKPQIILFWATWCPYCKALMPHLQSIRYEFGDSIGVLAISIMEDGDPQTYLEEAGQDFTLLLDGDAVAERYGIAGTPGVIIVDTKQHIRFDLRKLPGPDIGPDAAKMSNSQRARRLAPYWAAEIRKAIDEL